MPVEGKIENWEKSEKLSLRLELATGTVKVEGEQLSFSVSMNIDNKAFFVELGDYKVTYLLSDVVDDGLKLITDAMIQDKKEESLRKKTEHGTTKKQ